MLNNTQMKSINVICEEILKRQELYLQTLPTTDFLKNNYIKNIVRRLFWSIFLYMSITCSFILTFELMANWIKG